MVSKHQVSAVCSLSSSLPAPRESGPGPEAPLRRQRGPVKGKQSPAKPRLPPDLCFPDRMLAEGARPGEVEAILPQAARRNTLEDRKLADSPIRGRRSAGLSGVGPVLGLGQHGEEAPGLKRGKVTWRHPVGAGLDLKNELQQRHTRLRRDAAYLQGTREPGQSGSAETSVDGRPQVPSSASRHQINFPGRRVTPGRRGGTRP